MQNTLEFMHIAHVQELLDKVFENFQIEFAHCICPRIVRNSFFFYRQKTFECYENIFKKVLIDVKMNKYTAVDPLP